MIIRKYTENDEQGWLRCRVLSFLNTAYYDNVLKEKEVYENPSIELVAIMDNQVVGLIDIEYEKEPKSVCTTKDSLGGMIWHIAVHPDYQRKGIGEKLLEAAMKEAKELNLTYLEAWTRDDKWVQKWYEKMNFDQTTSYYHMYLEGNEIKTVQLPTRKSFYPVTMFAHYTGTDLEEFENLKRKHLCVCYVRSISYNTY
ncbi:GNAT family N-acetyltransferase [Lysinibacillus sp. 2017]|uniref:GNAT family N-acetyltransferase n=1 Tax=unclassified Lysinibacillus TaxID=2636778 RepID=UPI000D52906A|nr:MULTISPECIES: GNAT family N-acetyltransferase [unclassified Lysinibacillus]AWE06908.1 GNAT family N-acetyltransferase [Lysinibacillus sp. 2017]TGN37163.1 N-acetyltransferase [Lysinibacillus sp. S2017]